MNKRGRRSSKRQGFKERRRSKRPRKKRNKNASVVSKRLRLKGKG